MSIAGRVVFHRRIYLNFETFDPASPASSINGSLPLTYQQIAIGTVYSCIFIVLPITISNLNRTQILLRRTRANVAIGCSDAHPIPRIFEYLFLHRPNCNMHAAIWIFWEVIDWADSVICPATAKQQRSDESAVTLSITRHSHQKKNHLFNF